MHSNNPASCLTTASAHSRRVRSLALVVRLALVCLLAAYANAGIVVTSYDFTQINQAIPDGDEFGLSDSRGLPSGSDPILSVTVRLAIEGGYNGDLYVSLSHLDSTVILLNRVGRRSNTGVAIRLRGRGFSSLIR